MSFFIRSGDGGGSKGKAGSGGFAGKKRKLAEDSEGKKFKKVILFVYQKALIRTFHTSFFTKQ